MGTLRITGGLHRGRRLRAVPGRGTRPSMDAHRESLMNVLAPWLQDAAVLDCFGGTGAFALEALSRGAARADVLETARGACEAIRANADSVLGESQDVLRCVRTDTYRAALPGGPFDVVFVAPPYPHFRERAADVASLLGRVREVVVHDAAVVVQHERGDWGFERCGPGWELAREKTYGRTTFLVLRPADAGDEPPGVSSP